jgi:hypothetical protein
MARSLSVGGRSTRPERQRCCAPIRTPAQLNLMAHVVDIPLQEVRDLLDPGAERESVPKLGNVNRRPRPCMLRAHGQPPVCLRLRALPIWGGRLRGGRPDRNRTHKNQWLPRPEGVARLSGAAVTTVAVRLATTAVSKGSLRAVALPC